MGWVKKYIKKVSIKNACLERSFMKAKENGRDKSLIVRKFGQEIPVSEEKIL